ncbi:MAG TPA: hypothetical protein P5295_13720 [Spirochaetota bacterium]|nr:hypothetical protein [Spirochaetota bacterium]
MFDALYVLFTPVAFILIFAGFILIRVAKGWDRFNFNGPSVSITDFSINGDAGEILFEIKGRVSGLLSFIFDKLKLETEYRVYADGEGYYYDFMTPISKLKEFTPYHQIAGTAVGFSRNTFWLKIGIIIVLSFLYYLYYLIKKAATSSGFLEEEVSVAFPIFIIFLFIVAVASCIAGFIYSKRIVLLVESSGSLPVWIKFSESILERKNIKMSDLDRITNIINSKVNHHFNREVQFLRK